MELVVNPRGRSQQSGPGPTVERGGANSPTPLNGRARVGLLRATPETSTCEPVHAVQTYVFEASSLEEIADDLWARQV